MAEKKEGLRYTVTEQINSIETDVAALVGTVMRRLGVEEVAEFREFPGHHWYEIEESPYGKDFFMTPEGWISAAVGYIGIFADGEVEKNAEIVPTPPPTLDTAADVTAYVSN